MACRPTGDADCDADDFFAYLGALAPGDLSVCDTDGDADRDDFNVYLDLQVRWYG